MWSDFTVKRVDPDRRSDGVVLLTVGRNTRSIDKTSDREAVIAIDRLGRIVWHRLFEFGLMDCRRSLRDTLLVMGSDGRCAEIGLDGRLLEQWYCAPRFPDGLKGTALATEKLHHTICEISDGRLLSLSIRHEKLEDPVDGWTHRMADSVIVFDRKGRIETEFSLSPLLDPRRLGHSARIPYWAVQGWPDTLDWSHGNCAIVDPEDGGILLSLRHQDCVAKVTPDGGLVWILGDPTGWRAPWDSKLLAVEGGRLFYHQHDLSFAGSGELLLFDNGSTGTRPPEPVPPIEDRESYALGYAIDAEAGVARETWRFGGADLPWSQYVSGVCEMPNGSRLIACTGVVSDDQGRRVEFPPMGTGRIVLKEVAPDGTVPFEAGMADPGAGPDRGWNGFRPEYLPGDVAGKLRPHAG